MSMFLDKVAAAIFAAGEDGVDAESAFNSMDAAIKERYRLRARAAIQAMREPSKAMIEVGQLPPSRLIGITHLSAESLLARWTSMVDMATKEQT